MLRRFRNRFASGWPRAVAALIIYLIWVGVTILTGRAPTPNAGMVEIITGGVGRQFIFAIVLLTIVLVLFGWRDIGLSRVRSWRSLALIWFPALYLLLLFGVSLALGLPPAQVLAILAVNALLVGISEEAMFRGVLFGGLASAMRPWPAIWLTTFLFGIVHLLNVFVIGDLKTAGIQATAAAMSGFLYLAIRIRTGSLLPAVAYHAIWDFATFLIVVGAVGQASDQGTGPVDTSLTGVPLWQQFMPLAFVAPLFLYALFLLRGAGGGRA